MIDFFGFGGYKGKKALGFGIQAILEEADFECGLLPSSSLSGTLDVARESLNFSRWFSQSRNLTTSNSAFYRNGAN